MKTEGTNLLLLTISAFWGSSRWPLATYMSSRRQISIPVGGRYRQASLYDGCKTVYEIEICILAKQHLYIETGAWLPETATM